MVKKLFYFIAIMILVAFIISQFVFGWRIAFINDSNDITKYFAVSAEKEEIELLILERKKMSTTCCLVIKCSSQEMLNNELFSLCDPEIYGFDYVDRVHNEYTSFCEKTHRTK